jgi:hypothetical protein
VEEWNNGFLLLVHFLNRKDMKIHAIPSPPDVSEGNILFQTPTELETQPYTHCVDYEVKKEEGIERCYLNLFLVKSKIENNDFWICFDVEELRFEKMVYVLM